MLAIGTKHPPIGPQGNSCMCCPPIDGYAPLERDLHPGFGMVSLLLDGIEQDDGHEHDEPFTLAGCEAYIDGFTSAMDPTEAFLDWRVRVDGPMNDFTYQRHAPGEWALIEKGMGFA